VRLSFQHSFRLSHLKINNGHHHYGDYEDYMEQGYFIIAIKNFKLFKEERQSYGLMSNCLNIHFASKHACAFYKNEKFVYSLIITLDSV
jgi:hypothetical protein